MTDINLWLAIAGAVVSAVVGLLSGVAVAAWWLGTKNNILAQLVESVKAIQDSCPSSHTALATNIKDAVCNGFKRAIDDLSKDFESKLIRRDDKISEIDKTTAVLTERMRQAEMDIEAIFGIFNRRDLDHGGPDGERRSTTKHHS